MIRLLFVCALFLPLQVWAQAKTGEEEKTEDPAPTGEGKKTEDPAEAAAKAEAKREKERGEEAKARKKAEDEAAKAQEKARQDAVRQRELADAEALSQVNEQIKELHDVLQAVRAKLATAEQAAKDAAAQSEAAAAGVAKEQQALKEAKAELEAAENTAKQAETKAEAEEASEEDKAQAKAARAKVEPAEAAVEKVEGTLKTAQGAKESADDVLAEAQSQVEKVTQSVAEATAKLRSAREGVEVQKRWMAKRLRADLPMDELDAFLKPLTKAQLEEEALNWVQLVQRKVAAISATELWMKHNRTKGDQAQIDARSETLVLLQDDRAKLVDRARQILEEIRAKGGADDPKLKEQESYLAAVSGLRIQSGDTRGAIIAVYSWLKSDEGGLRWGKNLLKFLLTLLAFAIAGRFAGSAVAKGLSTSGFTDNQLLLKTLKGLIRRAVLLVGVLVALSMLEINTNPLLAALGGAALVVGLALQGTLANFASGILIIAYRPYDVGDVVNVAGTVGKVSGMNMLSTTLVTPDNQTVVIPNGAIWSGNITNVTGLPTRRVDLVFGIGYDDDIAHAERVLTEIVSANEKVLPDPAPVISISELGDSAVNFVCRPWCKTEDYWDVLWGMTREVKLRFDREGLSFPYPQQDVHMHSSAAAPSAEVPQPPTEEPPPGAGIPAPEQPPAGENTPPLG